MDRLSNAQQLLSFTEALHFFGLGHCSLVQRIKDTSQYQVKTVVHNASLLERTTLTWDMTWIMHVKKYGEAASGFNAVLLDLAKKNIWPPQDFTSLKVNRITQRDIERMSAR